jgi:hypothetical protein
MEPKKVITDLWATLLKAALLSNGHVDVEKKRI